MGRNTNIHRLALTSNIFELTEQYTICKITIAKISYNDNKD